MSQRFGGRYSPNASRNAAPATQQQRPHPVGARVNLLFVLPFIFAFKAFFQDPAGLTLNLLAFASLLSAAWLTREGVLAQAAYDARKLAKRPALPRKIFGALLTGLGLGFASAGTGPEGAIILGALGAALHLGSFGLDPMRDKTIDGIDQFQGERAAQAVTEAERHLAEMQAAIQRSGDRQLISRVANFAKTIRPLFREIENDPRRLSAARRYLGIYLIGARDATVKFADFYARHQDKTARTEYEALLDDLENRFALRRETLLADDRVALDIEIEVLRERLDREGLRHDS